MCWGGSSDGSTTSRRQVLVVLRVHRDARSVSSSTSSSWFSLVGVRRLGRFLGRGLVLPEGPRGALGSMRFNLVGREAPSTNRAGRRLVARALAARGLHLFAFRGVVTTSCRRDGVLCFCVCVWPARAQHMIKGGGGAAAAPRACLGYGCRRGAGAGVARGRGGGRGTLIFASRLGCRIKGCRSRGGDLGVRVRAQRLGLVPDGVPPVSAAPEAGIRWLVIVLANLGCRPDPAPEPRTVDPRARGPARPPAAARGCHILCRRIAYILGHQKACPKEI